MQFRKPIERKKEFDLEQFLLYLKKPGYLVNCLNIIIPARVDEILPTHIATIT